MSGHAKANGLSHRHRAAPAPSSLPPTASIAPPSSALSPSFSLWSPHPERARFEQFSLQWSVVWISLLFYIVYTRWFESFTAFHYLAVGLLLFLAPVLIPIIVPSHFLSSHLPLSRRYSSKANLYLFILAWMANYFWTHYFYSVLRASYTFPAHRLNHVPFALYLITHSYFMLYHTLACMMLRCTATSLPLSALAVVCFSLLTAFLETFTIQHFPYYDIPDRQAMYLYGSCFYALYFIVSFPMFYQLDERGNSWSLWRSAVEALGCSMIITQLLDAWRLGIGTVTDKPAANAPQHSVPFIY